MLLCGFVSFFEIRAHHVAQAGLELKEIHHLPLFSERWIQETQFSSSLFLMTCLKLDYPSSIVSDSTYKSEKQNKTKNRSCYLSLLTHHILEIFPPNRSS